MVNHMSSNVMMNVVDPTIVPVDRRKSTTHVVPLRPTVPWDLLIVAVVMEVCHSIQPDNVHLQHKPLIIS